MEGFNMIWIVDIVAIIILLVAVIKDTRKGFIRSIFGLIISVASIAVAFLCADMVTEMTNGAFGLQESIAKGLANTFADWGLAFDISQGGVEEALMQQDFFKTMPFLVELVMEQLPTVESSEAVYLNVHLGETVGVFATNIVVGVVLFILCRIVLTFVEKILTSLVESIKLFDAVNTLLGALVGLLKGAIVVSIICMLLSTLPAFSSLMEEMPNTLFVYEWFFANNPITKILATLM